MPRRDCIDPSTYYTCSMSAPSGSVRRSSFSLPRLLEALSIDRRREDNSPMAPQPNCAVYRITTTPAGHRGSESPEVACPIYALAGAVTAGRSTRQRGMVASTTIATMLSVAGTPVWSLTTPQMVGATAEAAIVAV